MGQVPWQNQYLIIGGGRLARHLTFWFSNQGMSLLNWERSKHSVAELECLVGQSQVVLLAISDASIESFLTQHQSLLGNKRVVHFSGVLTCVGAVGFHPLQAFSGPPYQLTDYERIPFVCEQREGISFAEVFPHLQNAVYYIKPEMKAFYHALCVMSGNFTQMLWSFVAEVMQQRLNLPQQVLDAYSERIFLNVQQNLRNNLKGCLLTGPLVRGDWESINRHLQALQVEDPSAHALYQEFLKFALHMRANQINQGEAGYGHT